MSATAAAGPCRAWRRAYATAFVPRPRLTVSEWADRYRIVTRPSPWKGPWRTDLVPYMREIMDAISDPSVERVVIQAASQIGKSELCQNVIGYYTDQDPSEILLVEPTEGAVKSFMKERIRPMFAATPALKGKLADADRDSENTVYLLQFPGGQLACGWATSATALSSRAIRILLLDEVDRYDDAIGKDGKEGDPVEQAIQRTANYPNRKVIAVSTPTDEALSRIARLFDDTDQRRLYVPCPRCGTYQVLEWGSVEYKNAAGDTDLDDVRYRCEAGCRIDERDRPAMLAQCEWRATSTGAHRGYQLSALYSPWVRWRDLAEQWSRACADRDRRGQREFYNLRLGETWTELGAHVTAGTLESHRENYDADVPDGVLILTCGVDVQHNRLELVVVGWGVGKENWAIEYRVIPGDTLITSGPSSPWTKLGEFIGRSWARADESALRLQCVCVDAGDGNRANEVYQFCRQHLAQYVFAVKGDDGPTRPIVSGKPTTTNALRVPLYLVGTDTAKDALFSRLAIDAHGPGYCHFPRDPGKQFDSAYFDGLCSERPKIVKVDGRPRRRWIKVRPRNEPLDCAVYATAALEILNPNLEAFAEARQKDRQTRPPKPPAAPAPGAGGVVRRGRGVVSRGVQV